MSLTAKILILILTGSLLTGVVLWILQTDKTLRWLIKYQLEQRLDASVTVNGPVSLTVDKVIRLRVDGLEIRRGDNQFSTDRLILLLDSHSLLEGPLRFTEISLAGPKVFLTDTPSETAPPLERLRALPTQLEQILLKLDTPPVMIDSIDISHGSLNYVDTDQNVQLTLTAASLVHDLPAYRLSLTGVLNGAPLTVTAKLERDNKVSQIHYTGQWGEYLIALDGQLNQGRILDTVLNISGPSARQFLTLVGAPEVREGELSLLLHLHEAQDQYVWFTHSRIGDLMFHGELRHRSDNPDFKLDFSTSGPSLREAGALLDYLEYGEQPYKATGTLSREGSLLTLHETEIHLGDGLFEAKGVLPDYPSFDNWTLDVKATDFSIAVLQPFSPCHIPDLPMDWRGQFSSETDGFETLDLELDAGPRSLKISGQLGEYPDFIGSSLTIASNGLDLGLFSGCLGLPLRGELPFSTALTLSHPDEAWLIRDWQLDSSLLGLKGRLDIAPGGGVTGQLKTEIRNLKQAALTIGQEAERLNELPVSLDFNLLAESGLIQISDGRVRSQALNGSVSVEYRQQTQGPLLSGELAVSGKQLNRLVNDLPTMIREVPFSVDAEWSTEFEGKLTTDALLTVASDKINLSGVLPLTNTYEGTRLDINGSGKNLSQTLAAFIAYPLPSDAFDIAFQLTHEDGEVNIRRLQLESAGHKLSGDLMLDLIPNLGRTRGKLKLAGDSARGLVQLAGMNPTFTDEPYELNLDINASETTYLITLENSRLGDSDLSGDIQITPGDVPLFDFNLHSDRIHLPTFIPSLITATDDKKDPVKPKDRIFPDEEIPWHYLSEIEVQFQHKADLVDLQPGNHASTQIAFTVQDGQFVSQNLSWQSDLSDGTAVLLLQQADEPDTGSIKFEIVSERIPLLWLFTGKPEVLQGERLVFNARLNSSGATSRALLANLDGQIAFRGGGGTINASKLDTLFGDFLVQMTRRVFGTAEKQTRIMCTAGAFNIRSGKVTFEPGLAVRTSRFDVLTTGDIMLANETLKLQLNSRSRQGIGVSAVTTLVPRVGIGGTLAKPQVNISATETALSGGAAIMSSGLSIIASGLWDRLRSSMENPCDAVYDRAIQDPKLGYGRLVDSSQIDQGK